MRRQGFTLAELFVVVTILAILMALLIPAIKQTAERHGRRGSCMSNLRNLGLACANYETQMNEYPGYVNQLSMTRGGGTTILMVPWTVKLLPFLDKKDIYDVWTGTNVVQSSTTPTPTPLMRFMLCPTNMPDSSFPNSLAYVANCGKRDYSSGSTYTPDLAGNGVFVNRFSGTLVMNHNSIKDGATSTLLFSENNQAGSYINAGGVQQGGWNVGPLNTPTNLAPYAANGEKECEIQTGFVFFEDDGTGNGTGTSNFSNTAYGARVPSRRINADKNYVFPAMSDAERNYEHARPSSQHPGGVNAVFCQGNTKFISDTIDYTTYQQLMTSDSKQSSFYDPKTDKLTIPDYDDEQLSR